MKKFLDQPVEKVIKKITVWEGLISLVIILAVVSRLVGLGDRVMSHDEVNHVVPAFDLFTGRGYRHDPVTHGPFQFHLMALSFFLFGDNDFTARLPHALFSVAAVIFVSVYFRRYLGKFGALVAGVLFTISPFMLFYGRYARNEAICVFLGILSIYALLRYFETREIKHLYGFTIVMALNFTAKETAYILSAQYLIFLLILFIRDFILSRWEENKLKLLVLVVNILLIVGISIAVLLSVLLFRSAYTRFGETEITALADGFLLSDINEILNLLGALFKFAAPGIAPLVLSVIFIIFIRGQLRWDLLKESRSFNVLVLLGSLVLPLLAPFLVRFAGMNPSAYTDPLVLFTNYIFIGYLFILSFFVGSIWNPDYWWKLASVFFGIYVFFYTTFLTNAMGLMTGMIGSLGHWLDQQSVQRGGQPPYYYAFLLLPIYEFLSLFGLIVAFYFGIKRKMFWEFRAQKSGLTHDNVDLKQANSPPDFAGGKKGTSTSKGSVDIFPVPALFIYLFLTGLIAFTIAGEKMPWLTSHIVFPLLLVAAWAFTKVARKFVDFPFKKERAFYLGVFALLINSLLIFIQLLGNRAPFQGTTQAALRNTNSFFALLLLDIGLFVSLVRVDIKAKKEKIKHTLALSFFLILTLVTVRASYRAAFINYDNAKEYLVYAHAADGPKRVMEQVEEISRRKTTGLDIEVAYDNHGLYPFWWYLRSYPKKIVYLEDPTRKLEEAPLIIAGQDKYAKLEPIVKDNFYSFEYMRLWWPMQDYWNLNWDRIYSAVSDPDMRQALFNIWFDRDYTQYAQVKENQNLTLETWLPSEKMRLYIRKDIASQLWEYATTASFEQEIEPDPYETNINSRKPDGFISSQGSDPGELNTPHGLDIAADGTIYVADSLNHRIQRFSQDGLLIDEWGSYANVLEGEAPGGTFNEPWDVAVAEDGSIFIADTFNHRIQKFDAFGRFVKMWGVFAQGETPESFWGPRGIVVDQNGNVLVTDTGNKRVVVFDSDLNFISQFGGGGFDPGQFDEPVGIAVNPEGQVIVADTWNRRVQTFESDQTGEQFTPVGSFDVSAWYGQGIDNKPYLTTDSEGNIFLSDPEVGRILKFNAEGEFLLGYQDINISDDLIGYPYGLGIDEDGNIWFSDASSHVISYIAEP
jgi:predicted membrane-bound mannosyltransferase/DNA-binding beta-propeller fold protein YncE